MVAASLNSRRPSLFSFLLTDGQLARVSSRQLNAPRYIFTRGRANVLARLHLPRPVGPPVKDRPREIPSSRREKSGGRGESSENYERVSCRLSSCACVRNISDVRTRYPKQQLTKWHYSSTNAERLIKPTEPRLQSRVNHESCYRSFLFCFLLFFSPFFFSLLTVPDLVRSSIGDIARIMSRPSSPSSAHKRLITPHIVDVSRLA